MLDKHMIEAFEKCQLISRRTGMSLIEVLDRGRLLVTDKRTTEISSLVLSRIIDELERLGPAGFIGRKGSTPADTFTAVLVYLKVVQEDLQKKITEFRVGERVGKSS